MELLRQGYRATDESNGVVWALITHDGDVDHYEVVEFILGESDAAIMSPYSGEPGHSFASLIGHKMGRRLALVKQVVGIVKESEDRIFEPEIIERVGESVKGVMTAMNKIGEAATDAARVIAKVASKLTRGKAIQFIRCRNTYLVRFHHGAHLADISDALRLVVVTFADQSRWTLIEFKGQVSIPCDKLPDDYVRLFEDVGVPVRSVLLYI